MLQRHDHQINRRDFLTCCEDRDRVGLAVDDYAFGRQFCQPFAPCHKGYAGRVQGIEDTGERGSHCAGAQNRD